jgi:hypothetical protein
LFQENKSYGSKKPFAFILWCTTPSRQAQFCLTTGCERYWRPFQN